MKEPAVLLVLLLMILPFSGCVENDVTSSRGSLPAATERTATWQPIVPMDRMTVVGFDPDGLEDDLAYMAAVPTGVFQGKDRVFASPVIFHEEEVEDREWRTLNSSQGVHYMTEDWFTYLDGSVYRIDAIGLEEDEIDIYTDRLDHANVKRYGTSPVALSSSLALDNWEHSEEAVVVPVTTTPPDTLETISGTLDGTLYSGSVENILFQGQKEPDPVNPNIHDFDVDEGFRYIEAYLEWNFLGIDTGDEVNPSSISERGKDLDLQIYFNELGEVAASEDWNVVQANLSRPFHPPWEFAHSYIYGNGSWSAYVTYMPTKSVEEGADPVAEPHPDDPSNRPMLEQNQDSTAFYDLEITMFPGEEYEIVDIPGYRASEGEFTLDWEGTGNLGLILINPAGAEVATVFDRSKPKVLSTRELGEGQYSIAVIDLDGTGDQIPFEVEYKWSQMRSRLGGNILSSASNGAVLASMKNAPLLYTSLSGVSGPTQEALDTLGVEKVYLVDLGGYSSSLKGKLEDSRGSFETGLEVEEIRSYSEIYGRIRKASGSASVVFTTLSGWHYWRPEEPDGPSGQMENGLFVGPAAYAAACHGSPVLITDNHPELSAPMAWHNEYWRYAYPRRIPPSVGCMVLNGWMVYDYLTEVGLDDSRVENILTVAGQFNIGQAWDRTFVGVANPGRLFGSPTDTSVWASRNALYPALIFSNPGVNPEHDPHNGNRITGSISHLPAPNPLTQDEREIAVEYPIAQSWVSYQHRFNERASKYWGCDYVGPSGVSPFWTESGHEIDEGNSNYRSSGQYYPDMTTSEVVPFYAEKAGYGSAFTTAFRPTMENLNRGSVMWFEVMHGGHQSYGDGSGVVGFWNDEGTSRGVPGQPDRNPWRGYEKGGTTEENVLEKVGPDTITMNKYFGGDGQYAGGGGPIIGEVYEDHDGVIIAIAEQLTQTNLVTGYMMDDELENIYNSGMIAGSCLIANTYLHLMMMRHGSIFQIIDPWLTSWYCAFAIEMFMREIALGSTVGEAYTEGMHHVGIEYLTGQWWWDIFENIVYFGDPSLFVYSPEYAWDEPEWLDAKNDPMIGGHTPYGATEHPNSVDDGPSMFLVLIAFIVLVGILLYVRRKGVKYIAKGIDRMVHKERYEDGGEEVMDAEVVEEKPSSEEG